MPVPPTFGVLASSSSGAAGTTWNNAVRDVAITLSGGDLTALITGVPASTFGTVKATTAKSAGRWHFEVTFTGVTSNSTGVGVSNPAGATNSFVGGPNSCGLFNNGNVGRNSTLVTTLSSFGNGAIIAVEVDLVSSLIFFQPFGGSRSAGIDISALGATVFPAWTGSVMGNQGVANFGATAFAVAVTPGFSAWG